MPNRIPSFEFLQRLPSATMNLIGGYINTSILEGDDVSANVAKSTQGTSTSVLSQRMSRLLNPVDDFGADPTGATDSTAALQSCFNAGVPIDLVGGTYLISGAISLPAKGVRVNGRGALIKTSSATANHFTLAGTAYGWQFDDISFSATVVKTAGWVFDCTAGTAGRLRWTNCGMQDQDEWSANGTRLWGGIAAAGCDSLKIHTCSFFGCRYAGVKAWNTNGITIGGGTRFVFCGSYTGTGGGVWLAGGTGGIYLDNMDCSNDTNLLIDLSESTTVNAQVFLGPNYVSDICASNGIHILAGALTLLMVNGSWICSAGGVSPANAPPGYANTYGAAWAGLLVETNNTQLTVVITGATIGNNANNGVVFNSGRLVMTGGWVWGNGENGVYFPNGLNSQLIEGDVVGTAFFGNQNYDVLGPNYSGAQIKLVGCTFQSTNRISGILIGANNQIVSACIGFNTVGIGGSEIVAGSTSVTIEHGLFGTPNIILLTLNSNISTSLSYGSVTSTSFTVSIPTAVGSVVGFAWRASLGVSD